MSTSVQPKTDEPKRLSSPTKTLMLSVRLSVPIEFQHTVNYVELNVLNMTVG